MLRMVDTRAEQRAWLERVLTQTGWAPTALAHNAGVAVTTVTRFLNDPEHSTALSARTIGSLERASGIRYGTDAKPGSFREPEAIPYEGASEGFLSQLIRNAAGTANGIDPWVLQSRALEQAGFMPGDVLIVDLNQQPAGGDVVCAQVYDWQRGKAETVFRIWEPPYLIAATQDPRLRRPYVVENEHVLIKGVVIGSIRSRLARAA